MKLVLFSDIHGNGEALRCFLEELPKLSYDALIFCGDIFGYYYDQKEILKMLESIPELIWLRGNHDVFFSKLFRKEEDEARYIENYGSTYRNVSERFSVKELALTESHPFLWEHTSGDGCRIGVFHGAPDDPENGRVYRDTIVTKPEAYEKYDLVLLGHTHRRMVRKIGETTVVNVGSLGQPRDGKGFTYTVIDTKDKIPEYRTVKPQLSRLYLQIAENDPELKKLTEILERRA